MKRWLLAGLVALLPVWASAATQAQYTNTDGSQSPSSVSLCADPNNAGKTIPCPGSGGTIAGGADVTEGTIGDTQTTGTVVGFLKSLWTNFFGTPVAIKVDGSGVTQPVSAASLPLPSGAATAANQTTANTSLATIATNTTSAATAANQCTSACVNGNQFNASVIPTVQNAAYAAGQSLGGLQTISIGSTNGLSGVLDQVSVASKGGSTVGMVVYVWSKNPTNTTCTDKSNFVASQTDNQYLVTPPFLLTPALVASAQDTAAYTPPWTGIGNFVNGSSNTDLYECVLANAAVTPATTSDLRFNLQGTKDAP